MAENARNPKVDAYMERAGTWRAEFETLRELILPTGLSEDFKWGHPCYSLDGKNVVLMHGFKDYCALLLMKGALLKDEGGILIQQTENVQSARQIRFTSLDQVKSQGNLIRAYVDEAIAVEKSGDKVVMKKTAEFDMPDEFRRRLDDMPALAEAFSALTPGRQRGYLLHFSSAKQEKTREARIDKCIPLILDGKGLDD